MAVLGVWDLCARGQSGCGDSTVTTGSHGDGDVTQSLLATEGSSPCFRLLWAALTACLQKPQQCLSSKGTNHPRCHVPVPQVW